MPKAETRAITWRAFKKWCRCRPGGQSPQCFDYCHYVGGSGYCIEPEDCPRWPRLPIVKEKS